MAYDYAERTLRGPNFWAGFADGLTSVLRRREVKWASFWLFVSAGALFFVLRLLPHSSNLSWRVTRPELQTRAATLTAAVSAPRVIQRELPPPAVAASAPSVSAVSPANPILAAIKPLSTVSFALHGTLPLDEADNLRWSLVRRTPAAATVYQAQRGVDWAALRDVEAEGEILLPAGFIWSFNETFASGPGYKQASGILAGGHCALATIFNAAARAANLSTQYKQHRTPFAGYTLAQSVNIYWGRDDLTVRNTLGSDLIFFWQLKKEGLTIHVISVASSTVRKTLPLLENVTIALTYGRPRSGRWGTLGQSDTVDASLAAALRFAARADAWNGDKGIVVALNPNVLMAGASPLDELYVYHLIAEAERRGAYVMLDVQTGGRDAQAAFNELMDKYLRENVWFDWDIEHISGGRATAAQINALAGAYFQRRAEKGYRQKGVFAFYIFDLSAIANPQQIQRQYDGGWVVPIFDGYGARASKLAKTEQFKQLFAGGEFGVMEFETRWGTKYDQISAQEYLSAHRDALIYASQ